MSQEQHNNPQKQLWDESYGLMLKMDDLFEGHSFQAVLVAMLRVTAKMTANSPNSDNAIEDVTMMLQRLHAEEINQINTAS